MHGLAVGHVTDVRLVYDRAKDAVLAPVRYEVEPERMLGVGVRVFKNAAEAVDALLKKGLRATVQSASLITGQQQVALDFRARCTAGQAHHGGRGFRLADGTEAAASPDCRPRPTTLLDKVNTIPFDQIGENLDGILKSVNDLASGPQMREALTKLAATLATAETFTRNLNSGTAPAFKQLPQMAAQLQKTVTNANKLLVSLDSGYGDNTQFNRDMERLLVQANDAVASIRALADLLARHPGGADQGAAGGRCGMSRGAAGVACASRRWRSPRRSPPAPRPTRCSTRSPRPRARRRRRTPRRAAAADRASRAIWNARRSSARPKTTGSTSWRTTGGASRCRRC